MLIVFAILNVLLIVLLAVNMAILKRTTMQRDDLRFELDNDYIWTHWSGRHTNLESERDDLYEQLVNAHTVIELLIEELDRNGRKTDLLDGGSEGFEAGTVRSYSCRAASSTG